MGNFREYITINQSFRFGRPIIKGTKISVYDILNWMANGMTVEDILEDYPELNAQQISACLFFAANKENRLIV